MNLLNWSRDYQLRIDLLAAASIHILLICAIIWPTLRSLRHHTNISWDKCLLYRNQLSYWETTVDTEGGGLSV
jgi:hypothetical protein